MADAHVLELRIHGIANAPPAATLCTADELVERKDGDEQGSFWRIKPVRGNDDATELPLVGGRHRAAHDERDDEHERQDAAAAPPSAAAPPGARITTEAYSWGNQARSGGSALALIWRAVVHLGWLLVLPFGLCNLAYWARRDIKGEQESPKWWAGGAGAGAIRVFALLQTLFYTVGLLTVSVHLIGLQCFRPSGGGDAGHYACAALPGWLDFLADWSPTARAALLGIVPVVVILFVYGIVLRARGGFHPDRSFDDEPMSREDRDADPADPPRPPLLATAGFWQRARIASTSERTHVAAALSLVLFLLAADALLDAVQLEPLELLTRFDHAASSAPIPYVAAVIAAIVLLGTFVMAFVTGLSGRLTGDRVKRRYATVLLAVSALGYAVWTIFAIVLTRTDTDGVAGAGDRALEGLVVVPTAIAALGALIAVHSLSWGYPLPYRLVSAVMLVAALVCVAGSELWAKNLSENANGTRLTLSGLAAAFVLLAILVSFTPLLDREDRERSRVAGWHGNGATVALLAAWFSSLVITSLLVLGTHAWLTADADAPVVTDHWRAIDAPTDAPIPAPPFSERFGAMLVIIVCVLLLVAAVGLVAGLRRFPAMSLPGLMYPKGMTPEELKAQRNRDEYLGGVRKLIDTTLPTTTTQRSGGTAGDSGPYDPRVIPRNDYPTSEHRPFGRLRAVAGARRIAGLAHRGESMLRMLAILTASALLFLGIPFFAEVLDGSLARAMRGASVSADLGASAEWARAASSVSAFISPFWNGLTGASGWVLGLLALVAAGSVVMNAVTSAERPLGLVWDIVCFFPRAGHPFSPPCYAERAVPEVAKRIRHFLSDEQEAGSDPYVILSAHSMGATIAAAAIFTLYEEEQRGHVRRGQPSARLEAPAPSRVARIALLTHGVQLRAYFSRFFPEVFGPRVLGVRGTMPPAIWRADPWTRQVLEEHDRPRVPIGETDDPPTLVRLLGGDLNRPESWVVPRWRSLWRRTDYLGFPVFGYWSNVTKGVNENPIDRGATERSPRDYLWTVARHNDYLSTLQYREARDELVDMLVDRDRSG